ncbi:hypothetical protein FGO68_gene7452 [Halteria grandinella]|uniref:Uncharacterized protein n=1 Tax=Halteria grandinella TaxID=5974 RepID=A0A8J8T4T9_HALGN|nr:hypothetical protein FGO68_gene7452 [Halteria grandinella]
MILYQFIMETPFAFLKIKNKYLLYSMFGMAFEELVLFKLWMCGVSKAYQRQVVSQYRQIDSFFQDFNFYIDPEEWNTIQLIFRTKETVDQLSRLLCIPQQQKTINFNIKFESDHRFTKEEWDIVYFKLMNLIKKSNIKLNKIEETIDDCMLQQMKYFQLGYFDDMAKIPRINLIISYSFFKVPYYIVIPKCEILSLDVRMVNRQSPLIEGLNADCVVVRQSVEKKAFFQFMDHVFPSKAILFDCCLLRPKVIIRYIEKSMRKGHLPLSVRKYIYCPIERWKAKLYHKIAFTDQELQEKFNVILVKPGCALKDLITVSNLLKHDKALRVYDESTLNTLQMSTLYHPAMNNSSFRFLQSGNMPKPFSNLSQFQQEVISLQQKTSNSSIVKHNEVYIESSFSDYSTHLVDAVFSSVSNITSACITMEYLREEESNPMAEKIDENAVALSNFKQLTTLSLRLKQSMYKQLPKYFSSLLERSTRLRSLEIKVTQFSQSLKVIYALLASLQSNLEVLTIEAEGENFSDSYDLKDILFNPFLKTKTLTLSFPHLSNMCDDIKFRTLGPEYRVSNYVDTLNLDFARFLSADDKGFIKLVREVHKRLGKRSRPIAIRSQYTRVSEGEYREMAELEPEVRVSVQVKIEGNIVERMCEMVDKIEAKREAK